MHNEISQAEHITIKTDPSIVISYNQIIESYIAVQPMTYDFYLLFLLCTQSSCAKAPADKEPQISAKSWIQFSKSSSVKCLVTSHLFINKNNGYIELFSMYDLTNTDDLCLPKAPKYIMTTKNFINFMIQRSQIYKQKPDQFFIAIDDQGHAHLTTDLQSLKKVSFLSTLQKKLAGIFSRRAQ